MAPQLLPEPFCRQRCHLSEVTDFAGLVRGPREGVEGGEEEGSWGIIGEVHSGYKICQFLFLLLQRVILFLR